ncbi:MAG: 3-deoxy-D-manno-octulosonate 8-phosphate phosphatase [Bacteroidetes bacterium RBG_13_46_8]|nr:MAG: 3-deoxy-D-manno-octulosonate 8-phosphate phosphatase [Bacteroidetes bacterium RBG_13_46_8]
MSNLKEKFSRVKAFAFDVDGVFTNGNVLLHPGGEYVRMMNIKDGYAVQYSIKAGYPVAIITGSYSRMVKKRFAYLGVKDIYMRSEKKTEAFESFRKKHGLEAENILYMGDDIPDYQVMMQAGVPVCPADAAEEIKGIAVYISHQRGGEGCVRDIVEQVLRLHGKWMKDGAFLW